MIEALKNLEFEKGEEIEEFGDSDSGSSMTPISETETSQNLIS